MTELEVFTTAFERLYDNWRDEIERTDYPDGSVVLLFETTEYEFDKDGKLVEMTNHAW